MGIRDRDDLVHAAHRPELHGDSIRKVRGGPGAPESKTAPETEQEAAAAASSRLLTQTSLGSFTTDSVPDSAPPCQSVASA